MKKRTVVFHNIKTNPEADPSRYWCGRPALSPERQEELEARTAGDDRYHWRWCLSCHRERARYFQKNPPKPFDVRDYIKGLRNRTDKDQEGAM